MSGLRSGKTPDEVAHETAALLVEECIFGEACALVVVGTKERTVFRFVHCSDLAVQIQTLKELLEILEGKRGQLDLQQ